MKIINNIKSNSNIENFLVKLRKNKRKNHIQQKRQDNEIIIDQSNHMNVKDDEIQDINN